MEEEEVSYEEPAYDHEAALFAKQASVCAESHDAWLNYFQTAIEKQAYAQGAVDGEQAAQAMEAGAAPEIPGTEEGGMSDDDVMQIIQEMVQTGEIAPEEAEAILAATAQDGQVTLEEIAAYLEQAVASGEIGQDEAAAIAQAIMAEVQGGAGMEEAPMPAEAAPVDPAAAEGVAKAASVISSLFN
jgi:polyhydroxyalkanoate synthesis regulator phasin